MARILVVSGSPSPESRTAALLGQLARGFADGDHEVDVLHLRTLPARALLHVDRSDPFLSDAAGRLARADAVVLGTPVYKASYTGLLKAWFDALDQFAFAGKTVLPLATGGSLTSVLALDYALRPVLASMGATHVVPGYFVLDRLIERGLGAVCTLDAAAQVELDQVVATFLVSIVPRPALAGLGSAAAERRPA